MAEEHFTDAELGFLRHARFGELPAPVRPADRVEVEETDAPRAWPELGLSREQQEALLGGG